MTSSAVFGARGVPRCTAVVVLACLLLPVTTMAASADRMADNRPNVIFILAEDMGYGDLACYGHPYAKTPNLDRLAAEGTKFGRFYVAGATCNPSRTGFMTSRSPPSFPNYMQDFGFQNVTTVTGLLHDAGYATGHIGKWHIGPDEGNGTYGIDSIDIMYGLRNDPRGKDAAIFDASIDFIEKNQDKPFYLNVWGHISHSPVKAHPYLLDRVGKVALNRSDFGPYMQEKFNDALSLRGDLNKGMRNWLAEIWSIDYLIGELVHKVDELGLRENTVIVFTSDHGAAPVNPRKQSTPLNMMGYGGGLRGQKHDFYEGGVRVPFIVRWPGHVPAGRVNDWSIMSALDWLPTVCNLAKVQIDPVMYEGEDLADVWLGGDRSRVNPLYWRFSRERSERAMLYGRWKLHIDKKRGASTLYDLIADREESEDLSNSTVSSVAKSMRENLEQWEAALPKQWCMLKYGCERPLMFDPSKPPTKVGPPRDVEFSSGIGLSTSIPASRPASALSKIISATLSSVISDVFIDSTKVSPIMLTPAPTPFLRATPHTTGEEGAHVMASNNIMDDGTNQLILNEQWQWKNELSFVGKNVDSPLKKCEGDCNKDDDCAPGLKCLKRADYGGPLEFVPGCIGEIESRTDYCFDPSDS